MKKIYFLLLLALSSKQFYAKPVPAYSARTVAEIFLLSNTALQVQSLSLFHTEYTAQGVPAYYIFNVNETQGFVIITADDAALPVIGYSTEGAFVHTPSASPVSYWLNERKQEVNYIQEHHLSATTEIKSLWNDYSTGPSVAKNNISNGVLANGVAPIVDSKWNQSPFYNALCPGGSVTGCVATTMAQIMRYWKYPAQGTSSSSYTHPTYGLQSANYSTATYNWNNMPGVVTTANNDVAIINYHCGVSVAMNYSPSGSGAQVLGGYPSAQYSFVNYFKYNSAIINGKYRSSFTDNNWLNLIKADLDLGRPVQYVGYDPGAGGHTWVCDGYDLNNMLHMNWGWGGSSDGFFNLNTLNPTGSNFSAGHQALLGIVPKAAFALDAGISRVINPTGIYCGNSTTFTPSIKVQNFGSTALTSCVINYKIDGNTVQTQNWTGSLVTGQFEIVNLPTITLTSGAHKITCFTTNPNNNTDADAANDQSVSEFIINSGGTYPFVEGFESINSLPAPTWGSSCSVANGSNWVLSSTVGSTGSRSVMIDNNANVKANVTNLDSYTGIDLSTNSTPYVNFKVAYQRKASTNNDKLQLFVSTNCGVTWQVKWTKTGSALASVSSLSSTAFVPQASEFTNYNVYIPSLANVPNVLFRWVFTADPNSPGNNIYVDDINISNSIGISEIIQNSDFSISPNPVAKGNALKVSFHLLKKQSISLSVTDVLGKVVEQVATQTFDAGNNDYTIGTNKTFGAGIYFVHLIIDGQKISQKFIVQD